MTAYWAGPLAGHVLALLGAEVVHLESPTRPDGARLVGGVPQTEDQFWERGPIFAALNTNKKSLTIDFRDPRGIDLLRRFIGTCDVIIENYTPRVLDQLGLDDEALRADHPGLVMLRMPGFGLEGPWRDQAAFAFVIEDASGLTWLTGHPDLLPFEPYCVGDPNAGLHALYGLILALEHRDETGQGGLVEAAMVDAAVNVAAEQVIESSAYGSPAGPRRQPRARRGAPEPLSRSRARRRTAATTAGSRSRSPPTRNGRRSAGCWAIPLGPPTPPWRPPPAARGSTTTSTHFWATGAASGRRTRSSSCCGEPVCRWERSSSHTASPSSRSWHRAASSRTCSIRSAVLPATAPSR